MPKKSCTIVGIIVQIMIITHTRMTKDCSMSRLWRLTYIDVDYVRVSQHIRSVRPLWTWEQLLPCDGFVSCVLFCPNWLRYCNEVAKSVHPQCKLILNCEGNLRKQGLHLRRRIFRRVLRVTCPYTHSHGESWGMHLPMRGTFTCDAHDTLPTMTKYCL